MYRAKESGKARFEVFDSSMHSHAVALLQLENDLRRAIERREFRVYYQPIIDLETDEVSGFEALVRWYHPERGLVPPDEFIGIAEETGLIVDIGIGVLRESCRQLREWQSTLGHKSLSVAVNLSAKQFAQPDLVNQVKEILQETGLDAQYLKLEITETVVMENAEVARNMLSQLCALGVQLSIDDFGTGYSSLSYLHRFPVKTLKIDRSFIGRMSANGENCEVVKTINTLANNLGMSVVAEGIETETQLVATQSDGLRLWTRLPLLTTANGGSRQFVCSGTPGRLASQSDRRQSGAVATAIGQLTDSDCRLPNESNDAMIRTIESMTLASSCRHLVNGHCYIELSLLTAWTFGLEYWHHSAIAFILAILKFPRASL